MLTHHPREAFVPVVRLTFHPRRSIPARSTRRLCVRTLPRASAASSEDPLPYEELFLKGPVPGDRLVRTISSSGEVSCRALTCTGLVSGAAQLHKTTAVASTAFGRALACALLLSSGKKDGEHLQIEFRGNGPLKGLTTIANGGGEVRGFMGNPRVVLPPRDGQLDVAGAIGRGVLAIVRSTPFAKQPYTGLVAISSGEVAEDLAHYLSDSEQTPSAIAAGVYVELDGSVSAAAGFLIQLLPGASEETADIVERNVRALGTPTELARSGKTPEDVVDALMQDLYPLELASVSPRYFCPCGMDRVRRTVSLIPRDEVHGILKAEGKFEGTSITHPLLSSLASSTPSVLTLLFH